MEETTQKILYTIGLDNISERDAYDAQGIPYKIPIDGLPLLAYVIQSETTETFTTNPTIILVTNEYLMEHGQNFDDIYNIAFESDKMDMYLFAARNDMVDGVFMDTDIKIMVKNPSSKNGLNGASGILHEHIRNDMMEFAESDTIICYMYSPHSCCFIAKEKYTQKTKGIMEKFENMIGPFKIGKC